MSIDTAGLTDDSPVAPAGGLSPFSRTSMTWDRSWPLKPDVVIEGGNAVKNALGPETAVGATDLR